ncbi:hypothetical protein VXM60_16170 [Shewanella khirikhana]|uniref:hypothetical protein n=1 Tax=Shewanella khirikhana TaxID=1965282 RepID=UPI0030CCE237
MELPASLNSFRARVTGAFRRPANNSLARALVSLRQFWHSLNFAQRSYLMATLLLIGETVLMLDLGTWFISLLTLMVLAALASEFWPRFLHVWHSLPGKALILLFYALVANFALGNAAGMVNEVTGVSAASLPYSHNFAILLSLPGWFFMTSVMMLLLAQVAMPFYLLLLLLLKPFGIHALWHPPHYRFVFTTALVRWFWSIALLVQLLMFGAFTGVGSDSGTLTSKLYDGFMEAEKELVNELPLKQTDADENEVIAAAAPVEPGADEALVDEALVDDVNTPDAEFGIHLSTNGERRSLASMPMQEMRARASRYHSLRQSMLEYFIYHYEADSRSRCEHEDGSKVVELNDYEILEILDHEAGDVRYSYKVKTCVSPAFGH